MTATELRQLHGEALTAEAFRLGLAPVRAWWSPSYRCVSLSMSRKWTPHANLAQAYACLATLRQWPWWHTSIVWRGDHGFVHAIEFGSHGDIKRDTRFEILFTSEPPTEAHAILLCAVLAASREELKR